MLVFFSTGMRSFRNNSAIDVSREEEDGSDASLATSERNQYRIWHGPTCRVLPAGWKWCLRSNGSFGNGPWPYVVTHSRVKSKVDLIGQDRFGFRNISNNAETWRKQTRRCQSHFQLDCDSHNRVLLSTNIFIFW